ncbi:MAG: TonB-dependent receptor [Lutibacter sp.]|nr:TonB-dependent receptor [Lutibacter sp.]
MKNLFLLKQNYIFIFFLAISSFAFAQTKSISGTINDAFGEPLPGVNILLKGTVIGTTSDIDGKYILSNLENGNYILEVSYVGFKTFNKAITIQNENVTVEVILNEDVMSLDDVVITGVANPRSKIESSISVTTLKPSLIAQSSPRSTAEIFRTIPGIRTESSGGDGNTNISVRGVPISAGGSKYLQLQEDGLPILLYGDISFATADIFLRADQNIARIEAIRGGSASTLSSNSPAGIINFISKTGEIEGGGAATTVGLDYNSLRTDFDYGSPMGEGVSFHVGGFYRQGEGVRDAGYLANKGGQLKLNLTKRFENGYARVYYKFLNDRAVAYMPMPIKVTGTNSNPTWGNIEGFDTTTGTQHSPYLSQNFGLDANGNPRNADVSDGMHPVSNAIGTEFSLNFKNDWNVNNKTKVSFNNGRFIAPFTADVGPVDDMVAIVGGYNGDDVTGATVTNATTGDAFYNPNGLAQTIIMFDTELENFNNFINDFKITKSFENVDITMGYFKANQNIEMSWLWNTYLMEVNGGDAALLDVTLANGTKITENGQASYGAAAFGNCCRVKYNSKYDISAPYAAITLKASPKFTIDASLRYDDVKVNGSGLGGVQSENLDVNNNGTIEPIERSVSVIDNTNPHPVNYDYNYTSYSFGGNYKLNDETAIFGRFSHGASGKADRIISPEEAHTSVGNPKDLLDQAELGYKRKFENAGLFITGFYASTTEEAGFEATTQDVRKNDYESMGVEIEGSLKLNNFDVRGALTYTNAEITSTIDGSNVGNKPRRQPDFIFSVIPSYNFGKNSEHIVGASIIGNSKSYAQDNNDLVMPGYAYVNMFGKITITKGFTVSLNVNNLFDTIGITESEEGSITEGQVNYVRARSISGRSSSLTFAYNF